MERTNLINERMHRGMSQEDMAKFIGYSLRQYSNWENGRATPHPSNADDIAKKLGKTKEELDLLPRKEQPAAIEGSPQEILEQIDSGISWCHRLINDGGRSEIEAGTNIAATYLPILRSIMATKYKHIAATLASKVYHLQQRGADHYSTPQAALAYIEKAVEYARMGQDAAWLATLLTLDATTYSYDLPSLCVPQRYRKSMGAIEEPITLLGKHRDSVPTQVQAWIYSQYAKILAVNGRGDEARIAVGQSQDWFARDATDIPGRYFTETNIVRQAGIAYLEMGDQQNALATFSSLIDIEMPDVRSKRPMGLQVRANTIKQMITSLLKAPPALKDKELTMRLWNARHQIAQDLGSIMLLGDSRKQYEIMACVFAGDPVIAALAERLHEG